jgi:hypothetical protein
MWLTGSLLGDLILVGLAFAGYVFWRRCEIYLRVRQKLRFAELLHSGLEEYRKAHGEYPVSPGFRPLRGHSPADVANWLPLSQQVITKLPAVIPNSVSGRSIWMYRSDGASFKLICHQPPEDEARMAVRNFARFVDPERSTAEEAHAYGVWSRGAEAW